MSLNRSAGFAALLALPLAAMAAEFHASDYAYAAPLIAYGRQALYATPLPLDVYQVATRADLGDVVVVNGLDEVVPFAIRRPVPAPEPPAESVALPLFPLQGPGNQPGDALRLRLRSGTTSVDIDQPAAAHAATLPNAYLIDARGLHEPLTRLHLSWAAGAPDFSARIVVDTSNDLTHWQLINATGTIANLHFAGQSFERSDLDLPRWLTPFFRLTFQGSSPVALTAVTGEHRMPRAELARLKSQVRGTATSVAGEYEFDLGARLPLDQLSLVLPEDNTLADAEFFARDSDKAEWRSVARGRLYRLAVAGGPDLTNTPIAITAVPARHWKVRIASAGGGIGKNAPQLDAGWRADELLFVARGAPPFRLLYGNAAGMPLAIGASTLLDANGARPDGKAIEPARAGLGARTELGGTDRLVPMTPPPDWKRWLLWGVLILGVALLGRMAFKLSRSL